MIDGNKVFYSRAKKDLTLRKLAKISGVAYSTISKIENGKSKGSILVASKLSNALGLKLEDIYIKDDGE